MWVTVTGAGDRVRVTGVVTRGLVTLRVTVTAAGDTGDG